MEQKFKKLLEKTKALENDPLFKSFEGALFKESAWYFHFLERSPAVITTNHKAVQPPIPQEESLVIPEKKYLLPPLCEVVFVGDSYSGEGDDLLGRMIGAMNLQVGEFHRLLFNPGLEKIVNLESNLLHPSSETLELLNFIQEKRPRYVVSLGAVVSGILLGRQEKLSAIRGQFFEKQIGDVEFEFMPVFHPDFLVINPNMKRTAWIDLQKVMERVGKKRSTL